METTYLVMFLPVHTSHIGWVSGYWICGGFVCCSFLKALWCWRGQCSAEQFASSDLVEFGVAMGSRSCHMELPRFSDMRPSPGVWGGSLNLAILGDGRVCK